MNQNWNKQWLSVRWSNEVLYWSVCRVAMPRKSKFDGTLELPPVGSSSRRAALLKIYRRNYKHRNKSSGQSTGQSAAPTGQSAAPTGQSAAPQPIVHDRGNNAILDEKEASPLAQASLSDRARARLSRKFFPLNEINAQASISDRARARLSCKFFPLNEIHYHAAARSPSLVGVFARHWWKRVKKGAVAGRSKHSRQFAPGSSSLSSPVENEALVSLEKPANAGALDSPEPCCPSPRRSMEPASQNQCGLPLSSPVETAEKAVQTVVTGQFMSRVEESMVREIYALRTRFRCNIPADRLRIYWRCGNGMMWNGYSSASPQPDSAGLLTKRRPWGNLSELCWLMKKQCCHMLWCTSQLCQELPPTFWQLKSPEHTCMGMYRYSMVIHILDFFLLLGLCQNLLRDIVPKRIWQWESETWGPYPAAV